MATKTRFFFIPLFVCFCLAADTPPVAQDLADQSLEQLMNIEVVSVGKKAQSLKTTAASVYVITAEDIHRSGMHSLPDALRLAPGVQVARIASGRWGITIRGFNGEFDNKLLVLVDGRVVYNQGWGGVYWDMEDVPLNDIERIEVIRGPAAAMWGVNAVNGVINILTKPAKSTQGGLLAAEGGSQDREASLRYGGQIGSKAAFRVGARHSSYDALSADPATPGGGFTSAFGWNTDSGNVRIDWNPSAQDTLFLSGQLYHSTMGQPALAITPTNPFPPPQDGRDESVSGSLMTQWEHIFSDGSSLQGRISWDSTGHKVAGMSLDHNIVEAELQYRRSLGPRNDVVWGVNYQDARYSLPSSADQLLTSTSVDLDMFSSFLEDEITLLPGKVFAVAGANVSHNHFTGFEVQPTGRLLWTPTKKLTSWAAVSRAVRTPVIDERSLDINTFAFPVSPELFGIATLMKNPSARSESVLSYEAGQRVQAGRRLSLDVSAFWNRYQHLLFMIQQPQQFIPAQGPNPPYLELPMSFENAYHAQSHGLELSATVAATTRWKLTGGYSWLRVRIAPYPGWAGTAYPPNNSPDHQWQLRSSWDVTQKLEFDAALFYTGMIPQDSVPRYLRGDFRVGWRAGEKIEFSGGVQDAFKANHPELPSMLQRQQLLVGRNVYGAATWRF